MPNEYNAQDKQSFARHYPKRMTAEVLLDAISRVTGAHGIRRPAPGTRAIELPDESVGSTFLDTFGRPKRDTACECERVTDASLGQSLMLLNSNEIQTKLSAAGSRAEPGEGPPARRREARGAVLDGLRPPPTSRRRPRRSTTWRSTRRTGRPPSRTSSGP